MENVSKLLVIDLRGGDVITACCIDHRAAQIDLITHAEINLTRLANNKTHTATYTGHSTYGLRLLLIEVERGVIRNVLAYVLYAEVLRENTYLSRTIEVQEGQTVVSTGLYGIVRHPMYMATVILFLAMPLVLGSVLSFLIMLCYIPIIVKRIGNEEQVLEKGLPGYREYKKKVRYRLIPGIW